MLQKQLVDFAALPDLSQNDVVVSNIRHYEALSRALEAIHVYRTDWLCSSPGIW